MRALIKPIILAGVFASALLMTEGHRISTYVYQFGNVPTQRNWGSRLLLSIVDSRNGNFIPARFSITVDGQMHYPDWLGAHGLRFVSIHVGRGERFVATYSRGTGAVEVPLPENAEEVQVHVVKGFDYIPQTVRVSLASDPIPIQVKLKRWNRVREKGWVAADEHLHFDRVEPAGDRDWLTMMAGDDLAHAYFLVLEGGNKPGVWAEQFAYGRQGEGSDHERLIVPGEEYRDSDQGHINLLGINRVIEPIIAGRDDWPWNHPPLHDILREAQRREGIGGVAHGGRGQHSTAVADAVLGSLDFWELGNKGLINPQLWYQLMNCGFIVPPAAGTDLPNFSAREIWQPFLGGFRMYVQVGDNRQFADWASAVKAGKVFVSSGPIIQLAVEGIGPGGTVRLPAGGGEVLVEAELSSPRTLSSFEIIQNGKPVSVSMEKSALEQIHSWKIRSRVRIDKSCWLAARGEGNYIPVYETNAVAHTAAIKILVGDEPISSTRDAASLIDLIRVRREYYLHEGRYKSDDDRHAAAALFDKAIEVLIPQLGDEAVN